MDVSRKKTLLEGQRLRVKCAALDRFVVISLSRADFKSGRNGM